jgi:hypothetical protein
MSTKVDYEAMTNKELQTLIDDFELTVNPKTPGKPTKAELVSVLMAFKVEQDIINGVEQDEIDEANDEEDEKLNDELEPVLAAKVKASKAIAQKDLPREQRRALQRADLLRKERVIIFDKQNTQTKIPAMPVTWGNTLIGFHTDIINFSHQKPQYVRRGALANLRDATFTYSHQEEEFSSVQQITELRYSITEVEGLTDDEIKVLAAQQRVNKLI